MKECPRAASSRARTTDRALTRRSLFASLAAVVTATSFLARAGLAHSDPLPLRPVRSVQIGGWFAVTATDAFLTLRRAVVLDGGLVPRCPHR